jgi:hypothetical protein
VSPIDPIRPVEGRAELPAVEPVILSPPERERQRREREEKRRELARRQAGAGRRPAPGRQRPDAGPGLDLRA